MVLRAALVASCLRGAFPPVDTRAVCLVRAMVIWCLMPNVIVVWTVVVVAVCWRCVEQELFALRILAG